MIVEGVFVLISYLIRSVTPPFLVLDRRIHHNLHCNELAPTSSWTFRVQKMEWVADDTKNSVILTSRNVNFEVDVFKINFSDFVLM